MIKYIAGLTALCLCLWLFLLRVLDKSKLNFWRYLIGSAGAFILMLVFLQPLVLEPLSRIVALLASLPGKFAGIYSSHYKYGVIFVDTAIGAVSLKIDFECSGIIEIIAYVSLLLFYRVYTVYERICVGVIGVVALVLANALRITVICLMIYFGGVDVYFIAHSIVGRIVFYALSILLYFYVFTKPQIIKQRVGSFRYDNH